MTNQKFFHPAKWSSSGLFFFYSGDDLLSVEFFTAFAFRGTILPRVWESLGTNSTRSTLNFKINIFCFSARRAVSSSKRKIWSAYNHNNLGDMSSYRRPPCKLAR